MKKLLFCILVTTSVNLLKAQDWIGYTLTNYAGVNSILVNPSEIADSRYIVDVNLAGANIAFDNDFIGLHKPGFFASNLTKEIKDGENFDFIKSAYFIDGWDAGKTNRSAKIMLNADGFGPSALIPLSPVHSLAISTRFRTIFNLDNVEPELAKQSLEGLEYEPLLKKSFRSDKFSMDVMGWSELNFTYARIIPILPDKKEHFFKAGATLKLLQGRFAAYLYGKNINYNFTNSDTISLFNCAVGYGHTSNVEFNPFNFYKGIQSWGLGGDIGFIYEYRPEHASFQTKNKKGEWAEQRDQNKYKIKVGFSVIDLGGIKFKKDPNSYDFTADVKDWDIYKIGGIESIQIWDDTLNNRWPNASATDKRTFNMTLPTSFKLYVDYCMVQHLYLNVGTSWSPVFKNDPNKVHDITSGWIIPRFESKFFGVGVPLSFSTMKHFDAGLFIYAGPLYMGSPDIIRNVTGANLKSVKYYFGVKVPIPYGRSQKITDRDGDGVIDTEDSCPEVAGPKENKGCPYGDKDSDGVLDNVDECIDVAGPKENNGCPYGDKDNDGVLDNVDECIDVAGPKENNGCPYGDKDNDGVLDNVDECIDVAGPKENNGCPYGDKDGDGIPDKDDACIDAPGPVENKGCPYLDTDGDGVLDKDDLCPRTPGPVENKGCPVLEQKEQEIIKRAFDNLEFDTGKDIIRSSSFTSLNELAQLLISKPAYGLKIAGHTDNVGDDQKNMILSKNRSNAVKNYLVGKGVQADRIVVEYYGETRPIADNNTAEGRQKNRRVEMNIIFE